MWMCAGNSEPYWPPPIHPQNQNKKDNMHKTCMQKGYKLVSSILIPIDNSGFIQFYSCVTAGFNWSMLKVDSSDVNWGSVPDCRRAMAHPASTRGWETEWINCPQCNELGLRMKPLKHTWLVPIGGKKALHDSLKFTDSIRFVPFSDPSLTPHAPRTRWYPYNQTTSPLVSSWLLLMDQTQES